MADHDDPAYQRIKRLEEENERLRMIILRIGAACSMASSAGTIQDLALILEEVQTWADGEPA